MADDPGQLLIDGIPLKDREVKIGGSIAVTAETYAQLLAGETLDVRVIARVAGRNQKFVVSQWGDDEASVTLKLEVIETKRVKRTDPDLTAETRAERNAEREAERAQEREQFEREQREWRAREEAERAAEAAEGGELAERRAAAQNGAHAAEGAVDETAPVSV